MHAIDTGIIHLFCLQTKHTRQGSHCWCCAYAGHDLMSVTALLVNLPPLSPCGLIKETLIGHWWSNALPRKWASDDRRSQHVRSGYEGELVSRDSRQSFYTVASPHVEYQIQFPFYLQAYFWLVSVFYAINTFQDSPWLCWCKLVLYTTLYWHLGQVLLIII